MFGLGFGEVILILIIALVFIGPKKLPELAKGLGKGLREFQNAAKGFQDQITKEVDDIKPKFDENDLPSVQAIKDEIKHDVIPSSNESGHGNWDPDQNEKPQIAETTPEATPVKKPDSSET